MPEGFRAEIVGPGHPILAGLGGEWPLLLGVNEVRLKDAPDVQLLARLPDVEGGHPLLATGTYGNGRTLAWTSDIGPHWLPQLCPLAGLCAAVAAGARVADPPGLTVSDCVAPGPVRDGSTRRAERRMPFVEATEQDHAFMRVALNARTSLRRRRARRVGAGRERPLVAQAQPAGPGGRSDRARRDGLPAPRRARASLPQRGPLHDAQPLHMCAGTILQFGIPRASSASGPTSRETATFSPGARVDVALLDDPAASTLWPASSASGRTSGTRTPEG